MTIRSIRYRFYCDGSLSKFLHIAGTDMKPLCGLDLISSGEWQYVQEEATCGNCAKQMWPF